MRVLAGGDFQPHLRHLPPLLPVCKTFLDVLRGNGPVCAPLPSPREAVFSAEIAWASLSLGGLRPKMWKDTRSRASTATLDKSSSRSLPFAAPRGLCVRLPPKGGPPPRLLAGGSIWRHSATGTQARRIWAKIANPSKLDCGRYGELPHQHAFLLGFCVFHVPFISQVFSQRLRSSRRAGKCIQTCVGQQWGVAARMAEPQILPMLAVRSGQLDPATRCAHARTTTHAHTHTRAGMRVVAKLWALRVGRPTLWPLDPLCAAATAAAAPTTVDATIYNYNYYCCCTTTTTSTTTTNSTTATTTCSTTTTTTITTATQTDKGAGRSRRVSVTPEHFGRRNQQAEIRRSHPRCQIALYALLQSKVMQRREVWQRKIRAHWNRMAARQRSR